MRMSSFASRRLGLKVPIAEPRLKGGIARFGSSCVPQCKRLQARPSTCRTYEIDPGILRYWRRKLGLENERAVHRTMIASGSPLVLSLLNFPFSEATRDGLETVFQGLLRGLPAQNLPSPYPSDTTVGAEAKPGHSASQFPKKKSPPQPSLRQARKVNHIVDKYIRPDVKPAADVAGDSAFFGRSDEEGTCILSA